MTTPKAQISTFSVYPAYLLTSSGAMYKGDPRIKFIPLFFSNFDAKPKSISFTFKFFMFSDVKSKFSNLKSGSNFNDEESRTGAGTNGVGSTLTNIYSKRFTISTCDGKNSFSQTFSNKIDVMLFNY